MRRLRQRQFAAPIAIMVAAAFCAFPPVGRAADNQATGELAGDATAITDSNVFSLGSTGGQLQLVKRAYLEDGTRVPTGTTLPAGSTVDFLIYISNGSAVPINDVVIRDVLDAAFVYQPGTIRIDNTEDSCAAAVCTPAEEDDIYSVTSGRTPLNDAVDGDVASYSAGISTVDVGDEYLANARLDIADSKVWAVVFTVQVQQ